MEFILNEQPTQHDFLKNRARQCNTVSFLGPPDIIMLHEFKAKGIFSGKAQTRSTRCPVSGLFIRSPAHLCTIFQKIITTRPKPTQHYSINKLSYFCYNPYQQKDFCFELQLPGKTILTTQQIGKEQWVIAEGHDLFYSELLMSSTLRFFHGGFSTLGVLFGQILNSAYLKEVIDTFLEHQKAGNDQLGEQGLRISNHQNLSIYLLTKGLHAYNLIQYIETVIVKSMIFNPRLSSCIKASLLYQQERYHQCIKYCKNKLDEDENQKCLLFYLSLSLSIVNQSSKAMRILKFILHEEKSTFLFKNLADILFKDSSVILALNLCNSLYKINYTEPPIWSYTYQMQKYRQNQPSLIKNNSSIRSRQEFNQYPDLSFVIKYGCYRSFLARVKYNGKVEQMYCKLVESILQTLKPSSRTKEMIYKQIACLIKDYGQDSVKQMRKSAFWLKSDAIQLQQRHKLNESFIELNKNQTMIVKQMKSEFFQYQEEQKACQQIIQKQVLQQVQPKSICQPELDVIFRQVLGDCELNHKISLALESIVELNSLEVSLPKYGKMKEDDPDLRELKAFLQYSCGLLKLKLNRKREAQALFKKCFRSARKIILRIGVAYQLTKLYLTVKNYKISIMCFQELVKSLQLCGIESIEILPAWLSEIASIFVQHESHFHPDKGEQYPNALKIIKLYNEATY